MMALSARERRCAEQKKKLKGTVFKKGLKKVLYSKGNFLVSLSLWVYWVFLSFSGCTHSLGFVLSGFWCGIEKTSTWTLCMTLITLLLLKASVSSFLALGGLYLLK